jgi:hypothetical protein
MGGFLESFVKNPVGTVSDTVSNFVSNPSGAIGDFWNTGGRDAATAAALLYGGNALYNAYGGAGAGAAGAGAGAAGAGAGAAGGSSWMLPAAILGSSLLGAGASRSAASTQADAATRAAELQLQQFREQALLQEPWRQAGIRALPKLEAQQNMMPAAFTGQVDLTQDPGYAFRLSEGQKALDRSAAARGGLISGGALKAAQRFGQDLGSQEYQNAYNRALTKYNADVAREATGYNRLAGLAGIGQTATGQIGAAGQNMATNVGNLMTSGAAANAAGQVGATNALTGGLSTYLNYNQGNNLVNALNARNVSMNPYYGGGGGYGGDYGGSSRAGMIDTPF